MSSFLITRCYRRARLTEELVEAWQFEHKEAMRARDAEDLICECLDLARLIQNAWQFTIDRLFEEEIDDLETIRKLLLDTNERALATLRRVQKMTSQTVVNGFAIDHLTKLNEPIQALAQLQVDMDKKWPKINPQMIADSMAAYERGEFKLSEDLLHESQSCGSEAN